MQKLQRKDKTMKFEFDTAKLKETGNKVKEQVLDHPIAAAAAAGAVLNGTAQLTNALVKRKNAKTARMNAKSWDREVSRRQRMK